MALDDQLKEIYDFWFGLDKSQWWTVSNEMDQQISDRFGNFYEDTHKNLPELDSLSAQQLLSLIILLDQFPRNMFRGTARSFSTDDQARNITCFALDKGLHQQLSPTEKVFLYLPLEHSENLDDQNLCVELFDQEPDLEYERDFAIKHRDIIEKFGRFPHRNEILDRPSTTEEIAYLEGGGETFGTKK